MKCSENLLKSVVERGVLEPEPDPAHPDVGEHGIATENVSQHRPHHHSRRGGGQPQHAEGTLRQARERTRELVQPDRIAVDEKISAARLAVLRKVDQCARAVVHVDGRHPALTSAVPMNPAAPVTNAVARVSLAMPPVWRAGAAMPTDNTRTVVVRRPYKRAPCAASPIGFAICNPVFDCAPL
jgi:hypothetical protein